MSVVGIMDIALALVYQGQHYTEPPRGSLMFMIGASLAVAYHTGGCYGAGGIFPRLFAYRTVRAQ
jgi:hypothetical protein